MDKISACRIFELQRIGIGIFTSMAFFSLSLLPIAYLCPVPDTRCLHTSTMTDNNPSNPIKDKTTVKEALPEAKKGQRSCGEDDNNLSLEIEALRAENQKLKEEIRMILNVYGPTNEGIYEPEQSTAERSMEDEQTKKKSKNIFKRFKRWRQQHKERHQQRKELERKYPQLGKQRKKDETNEAVIEAIIDTVTAVANG